jgi:xylulose-5-phosphate/fructose-6-phosphate phosphoketolase
MVVINDLDRFNLARDAVMRTPKFKNKIPEMTQLVEEKLAKHKQYIEQYGIDMPEIQNWKWSGK